MAKPAFRRPQEVPRIPIGRMALALSHPLRAGLRFCIVCQGGFAVELVTGSRPATVNGTLAERTIRDGRVADFDSADYFGFADNNDWDITGEITLVWRGILDTTASALLLVSKATFDVGANSPFYFSTSIGPALDFIRTNSAGDFSFWRGASPSSGSPTTLGVTNPAVSNTSCTLYVNGVGSAGSLLFSAGATTQTGNSQQLRIGSDSGLATTPKNLDGGVSIVMGWARQLTAAQMMSLHLDPYQLIVDKRDRRALFAGTSPPPPPPPANRNDLLPLLGVGD